MRDGDPVPERRARNQPGEKCKQTLLWPPLPGLLPATSWSLCPVSVGCSSFAVTSLTMPTVWTWTMSGQSGCCGSTGHKIVHCCLWQTRAHCAVVKQKTLLWQCSLRHTQQIPIHRHQQRQRQTERKRQIRVYLLRQVQSLLNFFQSFAARHWLIKLVLCQKENTILKLKPVTNDANQI